MSVHPVTVLGTFPVAQQVTGGVQTIAGIAGVIVSLAKMAFCFIQLASVSQDQKFWNKHEPRIGDRFDEAAEDLKVNAKMLGLGLITFIPVAGTIYNAIQWHRQANPVAATQYVPVYSPNHPDSNGLYASRYPDQLNFDNQ